MIANKNLEELNMMRLAPFIRSLIFRMFLVVISLILPVGALFAQQIQFNALYNCPDSSLYNFKVLDCTKDDCNVFFKNNSPDGGFKGEVSKSRITAAFRKGGCTINGQPLKAGATPPPAATTGATTGPPVTVADGGDELAEGATCVANVPKVPVGRSARPSPSLIKRVIYERYRDMESGRPVGMTFKSLILATSFKNRLSDGGLLHQSAPVNATVYRYKTDLVYCVKYTDSIIRTEIKEGYYRCFRDKSGEWLCTDDGRRSWNQSHLPVK